MKKNFVPKYVVMKKIVKCLKHNPCLCDTELSDKLRVPVKSITRSRLTLFYQGIIVFACFDRIDKRFVKTWKLNKGGMK